MRSSPSSKNLGPLWMALIRSANYSETISKLVQEELVDHTGPKMPKALRKYVNMVAHL